MRKTWGTNSHPVSQVDLLRRRFVRTSIALTLILSVVLSLHVLAATGDQKAPTRMDTDSRYALIYNGPGSAEGAPEAVAEVARQAGLSVKYVADVADIPRLLPGAALLAIGGTDDHLEPLRRQFTPAIITAIRQYLSGGGIYVGFCGGGYLASQGYENENGFVHGLGIVPATTDAFIEDSTPRILPVQWRGARRDLYFQYGPKFMLTNTSEAVEVVGTYHDGSVAALLCSYGKGKVFVSGPHPEADDSWGDEVDGGDPNWKAQPEIVTALVRDLLSDRPIGK